MTEFPVKTTARPISTDLGTLAPAPLTTRTVRRIRESSAAIVPYISYGAQRLGRLGVVGVALFMFSVIAFTSGNLSLREQVRNQAADLENARQEPSDSKSREVDTSPTMQANRFVKSLPGRSDVPQIMGSVVAIAAAAGLELERGSYEYVGSGDDAISRYRMSFPVTGSYPQVRQFVENLLATVPAIALDNVRIERDSISDQVIAADLQFTVLLGAKQ